MKKNVFQILLAVIFFVLLSSCVRHDNTLHVSIAGEIPSLDPALSYDTISASIIYQTYETLYEYNYLKRPYSLRPLLAEGMPKIEDNGKRYIIKIKKNIQYHSDPAFKNNIRYVKSADFVNQIKRMALKSAKSSGHWIFDGKIKGLAEFRNSVSDYTKLFDYQVKGLKTPDNHTLIIELLQPYPQMLYALAMTFTSPIPIEIINWYNNDLSTHIVGTGPFEFEKLNPKTGLKLKKFNSYPTSFYPGQGDRLANIEGLLKDSGKKIPFLDKIEYHIIKEPLERWNSFNSKKIDLLVVPRSNYTKIITPLGELRNDLKSKDIKLYISSTLTYWWLAFNMKDPLVGKNKNLRLAIAHAVNIEEYVRIFTNNVGQKANSIYPPGIPGYNPSSELPYEHNVEKAKKYLKKAGFASGLGLPVIRYDIRGTSTTSIRQAKFIKAELAKIGIKLKIHINSFPQFLEKSRQGNLQFWRGGWAMDYPDAENILQLLITKNHSPGPNATMYSNNEFDKLFNQMKLTVNGEKKYLLLNKMEKIIQNDIPWIMLYYARRYVLYHDHLKNFRHSDVIFNNFKYLKK